VTGQDRLDQLLDAALASGEVPDSATPAEREQLVAALAAAAAIRAASPAVTTEADAAMPAARARFERFVALNQPGVAPTPSRTAVNRPGFVARLLGRGPLALAGYAAAAVAVLAVVVLAGQRALFDSAATAQAFEPGDYVELQGVLSSEPDAAGNLTLESQFNRGLTVSVSPETSIVQNREGAAQSPLKAGDSVIVTGVVDKDRRIVARTVAVAVGLPQGPPPQRITFKELRERRPDLAGNVITLALSADGTKGRVLIAATGGQSYLVNVDGRSLQTLIETTAGLGARVNVTQDAGAAGRLFQLAPVAEEGATPVARALVRLAGTVTARDGAILTVQMADGRTRKVEVTRQTQLYLGASGLIRERILTGQAIIGHGVSVSGVPDRVAGVLKADVLFVGPRHLR
jgi:Domain of unknown function (DUF5666)